MGDRYAYSSPWAGGDRPWFRVGQVDVTTTVGVVALGVISMIVWAIEGAPHSFSYRLILASEGGIGGSVLEGQIWRLITWPLTNEPDIWTVILFAVFFMLGNQLENLLGRKPFLWFLVALTVFPAVVVTVLDAALPGFDGFVFGFRFVELGVLLAFVGQYPNARFWPGIPAWGLGAVVVGLDLLTALGDRNDFELVMVVTTVAVALIGIRSFGHAEELPWVPKVPLPAFVTGSSTPRPSAPRGQGRRRSSRRRGNLSAVPNPTPVRDDLADLEIDALLDQVAERGLESLSKDQRKRLEDHSKRLRKRRDG